MPEIQVCNPTSDIIASGTWSGTAPNRYTLIDDYPGATTADILTHGTTAGTILLGTDAFSIPSGSTVTNVTLNYYNYKNGTNTCNFRGRLCFSGGIAYTTSTAAHNPGNGIALVALRTHTWTTNPKTGVDWTVEDINRQSANAVVGFGFISTDANPTISVTSAQLSVTYEPPPSGNETQNRHSFLSSTGSSPIFSSAIIRS